MPNIIVRASDTGLPFNPEALAARIGEVLHTLASAIAAASVVGAVFVLCLSLGA